MTEKEHQENLAFLLKYGDAGYDDPLDNFPLPPDVKAARERLREKVAARGYPMTRMEVRAAVLADREASERYFNYERKKPIGSVE